MDKNHHKVIGYLDFRFAVDDIDDKVIFFLYAFLSLLIARMSLQISSSFQGKGLGSLLLKAAEVIAQQCQVEVCRLLVFQLNQGARRLYSRFGYVAEKDPNEHESWILMSKYIN